MHRHLLILLGVLGLLSASLQTTQAQVFAPQLGNELPAPPKREDPGVTFTELTLSPILAGIGFNKLVDSKHVFGLHYKTPIMLPFLINIVGGDYRYYFTGYRLDEPKGWRFSPFVRMGAMAALNLFDKQQLDFLPYAGIGIDIEYKLVYFRPHLLLSHHVSSGSTDDSFHHSIYGISNNLLTTSLMFTTFGFRF